MTRRNPDPWGEYKRDREDISTAAAFFMTFALLGLVAWVIFFGTGWIVPAAVDALPLKATRTPSTYSTPSISSAGVTFPLTSTTSSTADQAGASTSASSASRTAASATATATATPKPTVVKLRIANTGGDGVYLRRTANDDDRWIPWPENTVLEYQSEEKQNDGRTYKKVKDPRGNVGWMPAEYLTATQ